MSPTDERVWFSQPEFVISIQYAFKDKQLLQEGVTDQYVAIVGSAEYRHCGDLLSAFAEDVVKWWKATDDLEDLCADEYGAPVDELEGCSIPDTGMQITTELAQLIRNHSSSNYIGLSLMPTGPQHIYPDDHDRILRHGPLNDIQKVIDIARDLTDQYYEKEIKPANQIVEDQYMSIDEFGV